MTRWLETAVILWKNSNGVLTIPRKECTLCRQRTTFFHLAATRKSLRET